MAEPYESIDLSLGFSPQDPEKRINPETGSFEGEVPMDFGMGVVPTQPAVLKDTAEQRATKWTMGVNKDSKYREFLLSQIETGNELKEERLAEQANAMNVRNAKDSAIQKIINDKKGQLNDSDIEAVLRIQESPDVGTEDFYAAQFAEKMTNTTTEALLKRREPGEADFQAMGYLQKVIHLKEGVQRFKETLKAKYDEHGWLDAPPPDQAFNIKIDANLERFVPLLYDARMRSQFLALTGNDLATQYSKYMTMENPSDALKEIKDIATRMYAKNPEAALQFLNGFASYTTSDAALSNIFSVVDFGTVPGLITAGRLSANAYKRVAKSLGNRTFNPIKILEESL